MHPEIRVANTLPGQFYHNLTLFEESKEKVFAPSWLYLDDTSGLDAPYALKPAVFLPDVLDEPLLLSRNQKGELNVLSNVCTHRGKILVEEQGIQRVISCGYHGRCFHHDGQFKSMPGFEGVQDFPGPADNLAKIPFETCWNLVFASIKPKVPFREVYAPMLDRLDWLPLDRIQFYPEESRDFEFDAHWALYVENYLEGFHIPWVHPALNQALDVKSYAYETFPFCNLQLGIADEKQPCFQPPTGHQDFGKQVYAYYFWVFPNLMFNVYPWGLSLNIVEPVRLNRTRVRFRTYLFEEATGQDRELNRIEKTEFEDEAVVQSVQLGTRSRYYRHGRFSPTMEPCVHHFHSLLARSLNGDL